MDTLSNGFREERDALGAVEVPAASLYGAHTARGLENFGVSRMKLGDELALLEALAAVKVAAAQANAAVGALDEDVATAIVTAAREIMAGQWTDQFPIDLVQGGGGTATNMNLNEVIANRASELLGEPLGSYRRVHPNDHVNRSQSTNDVYPTALAIATVCTVAPAAEGFDHLAAALARQADQADGLTRLGRTCLRDALPVPISAPLRAQAAAITRLVGRLRVAADRLLEVPLGATAVGTGFGAADGYRERVVELLAAETGVPVRRSEDPFDALAHFDCYLEVAAAACDLMLLAAKIAADLRLLSSGPRAGIAELRLPAVQVGSSCMPGKVNPVIPELVMQISYEVRGHRTVVEAAVAAGELELNVMEPVIARHLLEALEVSGRTARVFANRCIDGLEWDVDVVEAHLQGSLEASVAAAVRNGYEAFMGR
jgi:aspartate ammonia-lyase